MNILDVDIDGAAERLRKAKTPRYKAYYRRLLLQAITNVLALQYGNACHYCGVETHLGDGPKVRQRTLDHLHPVSKGGTDTLENVVIACRSCNSSKGAKPLQSFAPRFTQEAR